MSLVFNNFFFVPIVFIQINELVKASQERETKTAQQLETARTIADRDLWDLRRQLSKAQDMHVEQVEQLERKHAEAIGMSLDYSECDSDLIYRTEN